MATYRVTWIDTRTNEHQSIDLASMQTAQMAATTLQRRTNNADAIRLHVFEPHVFHELSIAYPVK